MLYDHIISGLNIFLCKTNTNFLIAVVPLKVICVELHTTSLVVLLPFKEFCEVHCLQHGNCFLWLCSNHGHIIKYPAI